MQSSIWSIGLVVAIWGALISFALGRIAAALERANKILEEETKDEP